jgi:hypothetical protein
MALRDDVQSPANDPAFVSGPCPVTRVRYRPEAGLRGPTDGDASCVLLWVTARPLPETRRHQARPPRACPVLSHQSGRARGVERSRPGRRPAAKANDRGVVDLEHQWRPMLAPAAGSSCRCHAGAPPIVRRRETACASLCRRNLSQ